MNAAAEFVAYSRERDLSAHTLAAYRQDLRSFATFVGDQRSVKTIDGTCLVGFREELEGRRCLALATVKRRLACLRTFFAWLVRSKRIRVSPFARTSLAIRLPERLPRALTLDEATLVMKQRHLIDDAGALGVSLMIATGLRVGELAGLLRSDIDVQAGRLRIVGKGSRERVVFLTDGALLDELGHYLETCPPGPEVRTLLVDGRGVPLSTERLRRRVVRLGKVAGLRRRLTPHMLRHTAATLLLECGTDIRFVQRLLGHRSIVTTEIYTHVADHALRAAIVRANVVGRLGTAVEGAQ